jgi:ABC-2 type transport system ATP-binding protein
VTGPAVEVNNLGKVYGDVPAVNDLSFTVPAGHIVALLGPNGAGKTSTIEICEGFRRATTGSVRVLGLDPHADGAALRPRVGVMLQDGIGGYTGARALELLQLFAAYARNPLPAAALLDAVGLSDSARTQVRRLSGGQKQRLSLALALVARPELVFLDEPTAGMDPQARRATWDIVSDLRDSGVTVVLTTHYLEEAERLADSVVMINAGRLVACGTPTELTHAGAQGQVRFRARGGLAIAGLAAALPVGTQVAEEAPGKYLVTGAVDPQLLAAVTAWCAAEGVLPEDLAIERRSLEDVFLELTGPDRA